jgi:hypothetical protein
MPGWSCFSSSPTQSVVMVKWFFCFPGKCSLVLVLDRGPIYLKLQFTRGLCNINWYYQVCVQNLFLIMVVIS